MTALNFPANPTNGQTYENYVYDGTDGVWKRISPGGTLGNIDDVTINAPADGESLVYDSATGDWINADATVEVYGVDTAATDYFMIPVGGDADRPVTPANGHIRFNSDSGKPEWYSSDFSQWYNFYEFPSATFNVEYLVIAGGGASGGSIAGGGGAGGYRSSVSGEPSGGGSTAESPLTVTTGIAYNVTVGAGGSGGADSNGTNGADSIFSNITSLGGGYGGGGGDNNGNVGGSGGGGDWTEPGSGGTPSQGYAGSAGSGNTSTSFFKSGGGGGAGGPGNRGGGDNQDGGLGITSSITGSPVTRAGGGMAGAGSAQTGGDVEGGGGLGGIHNTRLSTSGQTNTGGGGGGSLAASFSTPGSVATNGGSGIVIIKYPSAQSISPSLGLSYTTTDLGTHKVTEFTAGAGTVTFS